MGIDYSPVLAYGLEFEDKHEAQDFLAEHITFSEEDLDEIDADGLQEWLYNHDCLNGEVLNSYSGYGFYIGFDLSCHSIQQFEDSLNRAKELWKQFFPSVDAQIVHTVSVW